MSSKINSLLVLIVCLSVNEENNWDMISPHVFPCWYARNNCSRCRVVDISDHLLLSFLWWLVHELLCGSCLTVQCESSQWSAGTWLSDSVLLRSPEPIPREWIGPQSRSVGVCFCGFPEKHWVIFFNLAKFLFEFYAGRSLLFLGALFVLTIVA